MMEVSIKIPVWLRILNVFFGLFLILISGYIIVNAEATIVTLLIFFIFLLLLSGLIRILNGIFDNHLTKKIRLVNFVLGLLLIGLGIIIWYIPDIGVDILIYLLAFGLMLQGISRIAVGGADSLLANWFRILLILLGVISIVLSSLVILLPDLGLAVLILLLSYGFLISGIGRIATGFSGWALVES